MASPRFISSLSPEATWSETGSVKEAPWEEHRTQRQGRLACRRAACPLSHLKSKSLGPAVPHARPLDDSTERVTEPMSLFLKNYLTLGGSKRLPPADAPRFTQGRETQFPPRGPIRLTDFSLKPI